MHRPYRVIALLGTFLLIPAGCPQFPITGSTGGGSGGGSSGGTTGSGANGGSSGTVSGAGASAVADGLSSQFPGCGDPDPAANWRDEILRLVNQQRQAHGAPPVVHSATLEDQATEFACEMIFYGFFGHVNPVTGATLPDRAAVYGYTYWLIGENLAAGQETPEEAVIAWMDSPCHRQNILNPAFTELGVGIRIGGDYRFYWVQEFGRPANAGPYNGPDYHDPQCAE